MISAQEQKHSAVGQACKGARVLRDSSNHPTSQAPAQPALVKNKQKHCFYLPTQEPTVGPNCMSQQAHLLRWAVEARRLWPLPWLHPKSPLRLAPPLPDRLLCAHGLTWA